MFNLKIDNDTKLKLLEKEDAYELFALTDKNREYLRRWLPWLDTVTRVEDSLNFIQAGKEKFEVRPAALPDNAWRIHISRPILRSIAIEEQLPGC